MSEREQLRCHASMRDKSERISQDMKGSMRARVCKTKMNPKRTRESICGNLVILKLKKKKKKRALSLKTAKSNKSMKLPFARGEFSAKSRFALLHECEMRSIKYVEYQQREKVWRLSGG